MTRTIRRVMVHSIDDIRIERVPCPSPSPGQVLVRPSWVGICGSDTHACLGRHPFISLPYHPGHEVVGVVQDAGDQVAGFRPGDGSWSSRISPAGAAHSAVRAATISAVTWRSSAARPPVVSPTCSPFLRAGYTICLPVSLTVTPS